MLLLHLWPQSQKFTTLSMMATSLTEIADSLVPEDQRQKVDKKVDDDVDEDFNKQLELAIKLSLNDLETDPDPKKSVNISSPASSNKTKSKKFKKMRDLDVPLQNKANLQLKNGQNGAQMFTTNNLTELSYEEQVQLAEARSKFDVDLVSDSDSSVCEEDLLEIALQKSMDPTEQIDLDNRLLLRALEASKLENDSSNAFFDSDTSSNSASTTSTSTSYRQLPDDVTALNGVFPNHKGHRKPDGVSARKRGGGGTNRPLSDHTNYSASNRPNLDSDEDEEIKMAIQLSLGHKPQSPIPKNSYLAAARKPTKTQLATKSHGSGPPRSTIGQNVYADPLKVFEARGAGAKSCPGTRRRPIIVDGCNVAFQHGKNDRYSAKGLLLVYQYFVNRFGYTNDEITIVNKYSKNMSEEDKAIVEGLYKINVLVYSPSRIVGGRLICSDDDLFVLNMAKEKNGIVVSLDQFRDAYSNTRDKEIKDVIKHRILQFAFKGDEIMFPSDPLGPHGPTLDEFLKF